MADFTKEARELLTRENFTPFGWNTLERAIAEALRAVAERAFSEGVAVGSKRYQYELGEAMPPNPYTKPALRFPNEFAKTIDAIRAAAKHKQGER